MYSPEVLDHFEHPRNAGEIGSPDATAELQNPACGDVLRLTCAVEGGRITDIRFRAKGCVPVMACGSALTELVKGQTVPEARTITREEILLKVGGLPAASTHASHLAFETLQALLRKIPE